VFNETLLWEEEGLPAVNRTYSVYVPESYEPGKPSGIVFVFHGWGDPGSGIKYGPWPAYYHDHYMYKEAADESGYITVYPIGLNDCKSGQSGCGAGTHKGEAFESWNAVGTTGSVGGDTTCDTTIAKDGKYKTCYESTAIKKGGCNICDWTTGYDDVGFVRTMVDRFKSSMCIDSSRVFATGCSNGGMFIHQLAQDMSDTFAAVAANCNGRPMVGYEKMPEGLPVSMMLVGGRHDGRIRSVEYESNASWWERYMPYEDDEPQAWDGYMYANTDDVFEAYRVHNRCPATPQPKGWSTIGVLNSLDPPPSTTGPNLCAYGNEQGMKVDCVTLFHDGCLGNTSLVSCQWDGCHDILIGNPVNIYQWFSENARV
jgi:poly(3-hydroxybutyrate) depolymerase